jgi:hypothetical protein
MPCDPEDYIPFEMKKTTFDYKFMTFILFKLFNKVQSLDSKNKNRFYCKNCLGERKWLQTWTLIYL